MIVFKGKALYVDVDDTLIYWKEPAQTKIAELTRQGKICFVNGEPYEKNLKVLEQIKRHHDRGHLVFVWSHGGGDWAEKAVDALQIREMITASMPKPDWAIDDSEKVIGQAKVYYLNEEGKDDLLKY